MPEPMHLDKNYQIALVINGSPFSQRKTRHWSIQLVDITVQEELCLCKYHVVGASGSFIYRAEMDYDLKDSRYSYSIWCVIKVLIWVSLSCASVLLKKVLGILSPSQLNAFHQAIHEVPINNADIEWNCQTFVMEIIYTLQSASLVGPYTYSECAGLM